MNVCNIPAKTIDDTAWRARERTDTGTAVTEHNDILCQVI